MKNEEKRDLPTVEQLSSELSRLKYGIGFRKTLVSTISTLIVVAAMAVLISTLFVPVLRVTGTSMTPTLLNDEFLVCIKSSNFKTGDVVAFHFNNKVLLKRVIGVAGDVVDITDDGEIFLNGEKLDEPYVNELAKGECDIELPYQVPDNRVFVLGDHRAVSVDSRSTAVGCIADEYVIGKVIFRVWPFDRVGTV